MTKVFALSVDADRQALIVVRRCGTDEITESRRVQEESAREGTTMESTCDEGRRRPHSSTRSPPDDSLLLQRALGLHEEVDPTLRGHEME